MALSDLASNKLGWRKKEIINILNEFPARMVRILINETISQELHCTLEEAKVMKTIKSSIVKKIFKEFE